MDEMPEGARLYYGPRGTFSMDVLRDDTTMGYEHACMILHGGPFMLELRGLRAAEDSVSYEVQNAAWHLPRPNVPQAMQFNTDGPAIDLTIPPPSDDENSSDMDVETSPTTAVVLTADPQHQMVSPEACLQGGYGFQFRFHAMSCFFSRSFLQHHVCAC